MIEHRSIKMMKKDVSSLKKISRIAQEHIEKLCVSMLMYKRVSHFVHALLGRPCLLSLLAVLVDRSVPEGDQ